MRNKPPVAPIDDPEPDTLGPAMLALEPKQRLFVTAYLRDASDHSRAAEAAREAAEHAVLDFLATWRSAWLATWPR